MLAVPAIGVCYTIRFWGVVKIDVVRPSNMYTKFHKNRLNRFRRVQFCAPWHEILYIRWVVFMIVAVYLSMTWLLTTVCAVMLNTESSCGLRSGASSSEPDEVDTSPLGRGVDVIGLFSFDSSSVIVILVSLNDCKWNNQLQIMFRNVSYYK